MKFATVSVNDGGDGGVDSLMGCWGDQHYAVVDSSGEVALSSSSPPDGDELKLLDPVVVDSATKATMDALDSLLSAPPVSQGGGGSFAELKPLPPFLASYTGHVRFNELYAPTQQLPPSPGGGGVGSSVGRLNGMLEANNNNSSVTNNNTLNNNNNVYKGCGVSTSAGELYYMSEPVTSTVDGVVTKHEDVLIGNIESEMDDFAAIIGNVMADTTVHTAGLDVVDTRDSWMDFDQLIDTACSPANKTVTVSDAEYLHEMANHFADCSPPPPPPTSSQNLPSIATSSTLQSLLTQGPTTPHYQNQMIKREPSATYHHMPLLQSRLQNGGVQQNGMSPAPKQENPSYQQQQQQQQQYAPCGAISKDMLPHTTLASPPGHVTTSEMPAPMNGTTGGGRFNQGSRNKQYIRNSPGGGGCSMDGFPPKIKSKSRSNKNKQSNSNSNNSATSAANSVATYPDGSTKEKPVHRCTICNRGFLNKSNIKVHLRTHTGEKPFRCDTCGKAFRQKAHLIKHQQIHKRVGRD